MHGLADIMRLVMGPSVTRRTCTYEICIQSHRQYREPQFPLTPSYEWHTRRTTQYRQLAFDDSLEADYSHDLEVEYINTAIQAD